MTDALFRRARPVHSAGWSRAQTPRPAPPGAPREHVLVVRAGHAAAGLASRAQDACTGYPDRNPTVQQIEQANQEAVQRLLRGQAVLMDVRPAHEVLPALGERVVLHAGPPIAWERMCGPLRGAVAGIAVFEGWAADLGAGEKLAASGRLAFHPNHHFSAVGPMTGLTTRSQAVLVVEIALSATAPTAHSTRVWAKCCASAPRTPRRCGGCAG